MKRIAAITALFLSLSLSSCVKIQVSPFDTSQGSEGLAGLIATTYAYLLFSTKTYVAVGDQGKAYTSNDGLTWTQRTVTSNTGITLNGVTALGSTFVAVGGNTSTIAAVFTSGDGITWTQALSLSGTGSTDFNDVTVGNGRVVAVGRVNGGAVVRSSIDLVNWSSSVPGGTLAKIAYDGASFVAGTSTPTAAYKSSDGITFSAGATAPLGSGKGSNLLGAALGIASARKVIFAGQYDISPQNALGAMTADSGTTFNNQTNMFGGSTSFFPRALAYNGTRVEAVGDSCNIDFTNSITTLSWSASALTMSGCTSINWKGLIWDGSKFIAVGSTGAAPRIAVSATGSSTDWTISSQTGMTTLNAVTYK